MVVSDMDFNHVPADVRWAIANWPEITERGAVTRFCERHGISRSVFYKIGAQVRVLGPVGATEPGSRRPHHSPSRMDPAVLEHALAVRTWLVEQGLDAGPLSVADRMRRQGLTAPSRATLARAFAAAGVSKPEPRKRPAIFQVVSQRYLKTSIVLTSNRGVGSWGEILGDTTVAAAMLDRLLHRSVVLNLDGDSYRLRAHHAANDTLRRTTTGTRQPLT